MPRFYIPRSSRKSTSGRFTIHLSKPRNTIALEAKRRKAGPIIDNPESACEVCQDTGFIINKLNHLACPNCQDYED